MPWPAGGPAQRHHPGRWCGMARTATGRAPGMTRPPELTMPDDAAAALREAYDTAQVILEYGSGGSTLIAADLPGRQVFSVESDRDWLAGLAAWFDAHPPRASLHLHHADIGRTGRWGRPVGSAGWTAYHRYPLSVWDRDDFAHPDVVLIDGRFRAACFVTTAIRITRPVTVLWDDYADRPAYHEVERLARPLRMHGRMARFELTPMTMSGADLAWVVTQFTRMQ